VALLILVAAPSSSQANSGTLDTGTAVGVAKPTPRRVAASNAGPAKWDAAGRVKCSVDSDTLGRTCGFRIVRNQPEAAVDIWIRNLAKGKAEYRFFRYTNQSFIGNDDSAVAWKRKGDNWSVSVDEKEFYLIPDSLLHGR
jgi:hypothetical protein